MMFASPFNSPQLRHSRAGRESGAMLMDSRVKPENDRTRDGFTLIELSIVLVIIGLIVGGVLVGRELIKAGEVRKTISEMDKVSTAVQAFRLKYNCLAGDCANATQFFGAGAQPDQTTNGNGNGMIENNQIMGNFSNTERAFFFDHLANAKLINTITFDENSGSPEDFVAGKEYPKTTVGNAFIAIYSSYNSTYSTSEWTTLTGHAFLLGITMTGDGAQTNPGFIKAPDAFSLDSKIDDGLPTTGRVQALAPDNPDADTVLGYLSVAAAPGSGSCASNASGTPYSYDRNDACALLIKAGF